MTAALEGSEWSVARPGRTFPPRKDPVPILQEAGLAPGPVWTGGKSRPHRDSIPDPPARSQWPYRLSYRVQLVHLVGFLSFVFILRCVILISRWHFSCLCAVCGSGY